jgi:hypothetical protein
MKRTADEIEAIEATETDDMDSEMEDTVDSSKIEIKIETPELEEELEEESEEEPEEKVVVESKTIESKEDLDLSEKMIINLRKMYLKMGKLNDLDKMLIKTICNEIIKKCN